MNDERRWYNPKEKSDQKDKKNFKQMMSIIK